MNHARMRAKRIERISSKGILFRGADRKNPLLFLLNMPFLSEENPSLLHTGDFLVGVKEVDPFNADIPNIAPGP